MTSLLDCQWCTRDDAREALGLPPLGGELGREAIATSELVGAISPHARLADFAIDPRATSTHSATCVYCDAPVTRAKCDTCGAPTGCAEQEQPKPVTIQFTGPVAVNLDGIRAALQRLPSEWVPR